MSNKEADTLRYSSFIIGCSIFTKDLVECAALWRSCQNRFKALGETELYQELTAFVLWQVLGSSSFPFVDQVVELHLDFVSFVVGIPFMDVFGNFLVGHFC